MRMCAISKKTANFGKTRGHRPGAAGGTSGPWSKKATAKNKKQLVNLRKVHVTNSKGAQETITVSMKAYKKARQNNGKFNAEYTISNFHVAANK
jgi:hypothetical protein